MLRNKSFEQPLSSNLVVSDWNTHREKDYVDCNLAWNIKTISRDGVTTEYSYDNQGQLTKEETRNASNAITSTYTYTYDTYARQGQKRQGRERIR